MTSNRKSQNIPVFQNLPVFSIPRVDSFWLNMHFNTQRYTLSSTPPNKIQMLVLWFDKAKNTSYDQRTNIFIIREIQGNATNETTTFSGLHFSRFFGLYSCDSAISVKFSLP